MVIIADFTIEQSHTCCFLWCFWSALQLWVVERISKVPKKVSMLWWVWCFAPFGRCRSTRLTSDPNPFPLSLLNRLRVRKSRNQLVTRLHARQARFGECVCLTIPSLDHGHEAAVYRNQNKTFALLWPVTFVVKDLSKRYHATTFGVCAVLTMLQPVSENVTVHKKQCCRRLFCDKIIGPWVQNHVSTVHIALIISIDYEYVIDRYV